VRLLVLSTVGNAEERYGEIDYEQPLGDDGLRVRAALASDWTNPGWKLEPYDIETQSTRAEAEVSYPLVRSRAWNLYLAGGLRAIDTWEDALGDPFVRDHLRVVYAGLATDFDDPLGGRSAASVGLRQGLRGLGASQPGDADLSRADGVPDATILALDASRVQVFGETDIGLYLAASGQYASNPLLVDQQFCVGGERFGRGYDPCDLAGDDGVGFTAEIQYTRSVDSTVLRGYQAYGFYDLGVVWNRDSEASDLPAKASLASAGAGVRTQLREQVYLDLEVAKPLTRVPASHNDKDPLVFLTLSVRF
jgi:hemolysin activation/secretion protein